jgi:hypothetical protein
MAHLQYLAHLAHRFRLTEISPHAPLQPSTLYNQPRTWPLHGK